MRNRKAAATTIVESRLTKDIQHHTQLSAVLHNRLDIAHFPHARKNQFIHTGYVIHHTAWDALRDFFTLKLSNESQNVWSASLGLWFGLWAYITAICHAWALVGVNEPSPDVMPSYFRPLDMWQGGNFTWTDEQLASQGLEWRRTIDATHLFALQYYAISCIFNASVVTLYHALCSYTPLYHIMSALDLGATQFVGSNLVVAGSLVPGLAIWPHHFVHLLQTYVWESTPKWLPLAVGVGFLACASALIVYVRYKRQAESPRWLLLLNAWPLLFLALDYGWARYRHKTSLIALSVFIGGAALFGTKYPEKLFAGDTNSKARRIVDMFGSSHMIWHLAYLSSWVLYFYDGLECALAEGGHLAPTAR